MSNGLFDLNTERGKAQMAQATRVLFEHFMERNKTWSEMLADACTPKTCISCGSKTQPCCGH
jgi:hypothetical protein